MRIKVASQCFKSSQVSFSLQFTPKSSYSSCTSSNYTSRVDPQSKRERCRDTPPYLVGVSTAAPRLCGVAWRRGDVRAQTRRAGWRLSTPISQAKLGPTRRHRCRLPQCKPIWPTSSLCLHTSRDLSKVYMIKRGSYSLSGFHPFFVCMREIPIHITTRNPASIRVYKYRPSHFPTAHLMVLVKFTKTYLVR